MLLLIIPSQAPASIKVPSDLKFNKSKTIKSCKFCDLICEISKLNDLTIYPEVKDYLSILSKNRKDLHKLIQDGLKLL